MEVQLESQFKPGGSKEGRSTIRGLRGKENESLGHDILDVDGTFREEGVRGQDIV